MTAEQLADALRDFTPNTTLLRKCETELRRLAAVERNCPEALQAASDTYYRAFAALESRAVAAEGERDELQAWAQFVVTEITRQRQYYDKHPASISHSPFQVGGMHTFLLNLHNGLFATFPGDFVAALESAKAVLAMQERNP